MLTFWTPLGVGLTQAVGSTLSLSRNERVARAGLLLVAVASVLGAVWVATAPLIDERRGR